MLKHSVSLLVLIVFCFSVRAQSTAGNPAPKIPGRTSFYVELGGPGILFSANIDSRFKPSRLGWGGRAGIGFVTATEEKPVPGQNYPDWEQVSVLTVPVQVN